MIVVFGGHGGLGKGLTEHLSLFCKVECPKSSEVNIAEADEVSAYFEGKTPDVVINLAVFDSPAMIHTTDEMLVNKEVQVNAIGLVNIARSSLKIMRKRGSGKIIHVSSILSSRPIAGTSIYAATKSFGESVIRSISIENGKYNITANAIQLGYFDAGLINKVPPNILEDIIQKIPLKRLGKSSEFWNAVDFIIENDYINGSILELTGGLHV